VAHHGGSGLQADPRRAALWDFPEHAAPPEVAAHAARRQLAGRSCRPRSSARTAPSSVPGCLRLWVETRDDVEHPGAAPVGRPTPATIALFRRRGHQRARKGGQPLVRPTTESQSTIGSVQRRPEARTILWLGRIAPEELLTLGRLLRRLRPAAGPLSGGARRSISTRPRSSRRAPRPLTCSWNSWPFRSRTRTGGHPLALVLSRSRSGSGLRRTVPSGA